MVVGRSCRVSGLSGLILRSTFLWRCFCRHRPPCIVYPRRYRRHAPSWALEGVWPDIWGCVFELWLAPGAAKAFSAFLKAFPGHQGRPQKCTPENPARLLSRTQFSVFRFDQFFEGILKSAAPVEVRTLVRHHDTQALAVSLWDPARKSRVLPKTCGIKI